LAWIDENGKYPAPDAQLILYPKYPEVRLSGFLKGCHNAPSGIMKVRDAGRVLFLGITPQGQVLAHAVDFDHPLAKAVHARTDLRSFGVFLEIPPNPDTGTKALLLAKLTEICHKHRIPSQKLDTDGNPHPYSARNGGGYTLEAELGITPNGYAEPDYLGWEIKQYGVGDFVRFIPKSPVTLMTPEPTGGIYKESGAEFFLKRYGYPDKQGKVARVNFGGIYACGRDFHAETGLRLELDGYDRDTGKIMDINGGILLRSRQDDIAALWKFTKILEHWQRKHAQAAYVPSISWKSPPEYEFGPRILLCEQTNFSLFLNAVCDGLVYYDPGIKMEPDSSKKMVIKRRSQFRIKQPLLPKLYISSSVAVLEQEPLP